MNLEHLRSHEGPSLGTSGWRTVDQSLIDDFGKISGENSWIHSDPARAAAETAFGGTIAQGYLTLALIPEFVAEIVDLGRVARVGLNYGLDRVRFPAPLLCDARVRATLAVASVEESETGARLAFDVVVEQEHSDRPVCVARILYHFHD